MAKLRGILLDNKGNFWFAADGYIVTIEIPLLTLKRGSGITSIANGLKKTTFRKKL